MIEERIELNHKDTWTGSYRDLKFEIVRWRFSHDSGEDMWNYYVYFRKSKLGDEVFNWIGSGFVEGKWGWDYHDSPLSRLSWHYGMTFGEIIRDYQQEIISIKAGCDYSHLWDEGQSYSKEGLLIDMKRTVDDFLRYVGEFSSPQPTVTLPTNEST